MTDVELGPALAAARPKGIYFPGLLVMHYPSFGHEFYTAKDWWGILIPGSTPYANHFPFRDLAGIYRTWKREHLRLPGEPLGRKSNLVHNFYTRLPIEFHHVWTEGDCFFIRNPSKALGQLKMWSKVCTWYEKTVYTPDFPERAIYIPSPAFVSPKTLKLP
jgi:hypothetical protein